MYLITKPMQRTIMKLVVTGLPPRQAEALLHTANGMTRKEAAKRMNCSPQNVVMLLDAVRFKLHARTAPEAVANAFRAGVLRLLSLVLILAAGALTLPAPAVAQDNTTAPRVRVRQYSRARRREEQFSAGASHALRSGLPADLLKFIHLPATFA